MANWIGRLFKRDARTPASQPVARAVPSWVANAPLTPTHDVRTLLDQGYRRNAIAFAAIQQITTSISQLPPKVYDRKGDEVEDTMHPLNQILKRPNPEQSWRAFCSGAAMNAISVGDAYLHKVRNAMSMPVQMWNLRADRIHPIVGTKGYVENYAYRIEGIDEQRVPAEDVIRLEYSQDPLDDYRGLSPLAVAARAIDLDNKGLDYLRAFFLNGAAPAGLLRFKEPAEPEERERIRLLWKKLYGQGRGWHEVAVLDAFAEYQELGSRPEKLGMDAIWGATESRICAVLGVPPIMVQVLIGIQNSTYSNYREAVKAFWSETMVPLAGLVSDQLTFGLAYEFGAPGEYEIRLDCGGVEVLQEGLEVRRTGAVTLYQGGVIKLNEARVMSGFDEDGPEADVYVTGSTDAPDAGEVNDAVDDLKDGNDPTKKKDNPFEKKDDDDEEEEEEEEKRKAKEKEKAQRQTMIDLMQREADVSEIVAVLEAEDVD
jgi:HK97 family phage portal protein